MGRGGNGLAADFGFGGCGGGRGVFDGGNGPVGWDGSRGGDGVDVWRPDTVDGFLVALAVYLSVAEGGRGVCRGGQVAAHAG